MLRKRSLTLQGHQTSIALEPEFWAVLEGAAAARGLADGQRVRIFNARGAFHATLRIHAETPWVRAGVVSAPSIWWQKLSGDGCNANAVTSQALADLGGGADDGLWPRWRAG